MILAVDQAPLGHRVNIYQQMSVISDIEVALDDLEREFMMKSQFGNLFEFAGLSAWSGAFGLFTLTRMLDVKKENEIWLGFAGKPIRFSLREFKIVTSLKCGKYPNIEKKKKRAHVIPEFYKTMFGSEKEAPIERALEILRNRSVEDPQMRLRYACLAIVDAILVSSVHFNRVKVNMDHAEMVDVEMIIRPEVEFNPVQEDLSWSDDEVDERVDHMMRLANQGYEFKSKMFGPGLTPDQLVGQTRSKREVRKSKLAANKKGKCKMRKSGGISRVGPQSSTYAPFDDNIGRVTEEKIRSIVVNMLADNNKKIESMLIANNRIIIDGVTDWYINHSLPQANLYGGANPTSPTNANRSPPDEPPSPIGNQSPPLSSFPDGHGPRSPNLGGDGHEHNGVNRMGITLVFPSVEEILSQYGGGSISVVADEPNIRCEAKDGEEASLQTDFQQKHAPVLPPAPRIQSKSVGDDVTQVPMGGLTHPKGVDGVYEVGDASDGVPHGNTGLETAPTIRVPISEQNDISPKPAAKVLSGEPKVGNLNPLDSRTTDEMDAQTPSAVDGEVGSHLDPGPTRR